MNVAINSLEPQQYHFLVEPITRTEVIVLQVILDVGIATKILLNVQKQFDR